MTRRCPVPEAEQKRIAAQMYDTQPQLIVHRTPQTVAESSSSALAKRIAVQIYDTQPQSIAQHPNYARAESSSSSLSPPNASLFDSLQPANSSFSTSQASWNSPCSDSSLGLGTMSAFRQIRLRDNPGHVPVSSHWFEPGMFLAPNEHVATSNRSVSEYGDMYAEMQGEVQMFETTSAETVASDGMTSDYLLSGMDACMDIDYTTPTASTAGRTVHDSLNEYIPAFNDAPLFQYSTTRFPVLNSVPNSGRSSSHLQVTSHRPRRASNPDAPPHNSPAFSFVPVEFDVSTQKQTSPTSPTVNGPRTKGRKGPLNERQRAGAAIMRQLGACASCRKRRCKCDGGDPCDSCLKYFGGDLKYNPCRSSVSNRISELASVLLPAALKWHPSRKTPASFLSKPYETSVELFILPFNLNFGPDLYLQVRSIVTADQKAFLHAHVAYSWPAQVGINGQKSTYDHIMLPAILEEPRESLAYQLKWHLGRLVDHHFHAFPAFKSDLNVLPPIYRFYQSTANSDREFLGKCLKLLVLTHCAGDVYVSQDNISVKQIVWDVLEYDGDCRITPCLIRGQIGPVMSEIAKEWMEEILEELHTRTSNRKCSEFPNVIIAHMLLAMVVETVQYHSCKLGFHESASADFNERLPMVLKACRAMEERGVSELYTLYKRCFSGCHEKVHNLSYSSRNRMSNDPSDRFIVELRDAITTAQSYIQERTAIQISEDMELSLFFDRLLARLFTPVVNDALQNDTFFCNTRPRSSTT